mmetsp:Transcript_12123/g.56277  ORF Transcript_12123/g.56277 Transcript_12123/m.56277 type:complete len:252 (-) Transcript_12123:957-1712(-)
MYQTPPPTEHLRHFLHLADESSLVAAAFPELHEQLARQRDHLPHRFDGRHANAERLEHDVLHQHGVPVEFRVGTLGMRRGRSRLGGRRSRSPSGVLQQRIQIDRPVVQVMYQTPPPAEHIRQLFHLAVESSLVVAAVVSELHEQLLRQRDHLPHRINGRHLNAERLEHDVLHQHGVPVDFRVGPLGGRRGRSRLRLRRAGLLRPRLRLRRRSRRRAGRHLLIVVIDIGTGARLERTVLLVVSIIGLVVVVI